jgi:hypothetical protein
VQKQQDPGTAWFSGVVAVVDACSGKDVVQ